jgi:small subunit ribosomal protein S12
MPTNNQITYNKARKGRKKKIKTPGLTGSPHKKGTCMQLLIKTPRKPSSGKRKVTRVHLRNSKKVNSHIPGIGHTLQKYSTVLIRGCRVRDIPAMKYRVIRGKFDAKGVYERVSSRSKYGIEKKK